MERWFFGEDKANGTTAGKQQMQLTETSGRRHTLRVLVNQSLQPNEHVAVTGECSCLGNWLPARVVQLHRENGEFRKIFKYFRLFFGCKSKLVREIYLDRFIKVI